MSQERKALNSVAISVMVRDGTLWPGIAAGLLFAGEFVFINREMKWQHSS